MTINRFELCANEVDCYHITDLETGKRYTDLNLEEICTLLNNLNMTATNAIEALDILNEENKKLKQLLQKIITKEFELSSDDNDYDPLSEFFNNEVSISQIEVDINVEKED